MTLTSADIYLLKAIDSFHFEIDQAVESLSIAYGYDEEHAGVLCLYGRLYSEYLHQYDEAERYFEMALFYDPMYVQTYQHYIRLLIFLEKLEKAKLMITKAMACPGSNKPLLIYQRGIIAESTGDFDAAMEQMQIAASKAINNDLHDFITNEIKRVKSKMPDQEAENEDKPLKKSKFFKLRK